MKLQGKPNVGKSALVRVTQGDTILNRKFEPDGVAADNNGLVFDISVSIWSNGFFQVASHGKLKLKQYLNVGESRFSPKL